MTAAGHPFIDPVKTLLWVESDGKFRELITTFLEKTSRFRVLPCADAPAALETLKANPRIDLILSDQRVIVGDGILAKKALTTSTPIIIITNTFSEAVSALRLYAMKIPVAKKPIAPAKLLALIDHVLHGRPLPASPVMAAWWGDES